MRTSHNYGLMNRAVCSCKLWPVKFDSTSLLWLFCWNCRDIRAGVFRAGSFGPIATPAPCSWNMLYIDKCNYSEANVFESRLQGTTFKAALWYTLQWKAFKGLTEQSNLFDRQIRLTCLHPCRHSIQTMWWFIWEVTIVQFTAHNWLHRSMCKQNNCNLSYEL